MSVRMALAILALFLFAGPGTAQWRSVPPAPATAPMQWPSPAGGRALSLSTDSAATAAGTVGAVVGASIGAGLALPVFGILALASRCRTSAPDVSCYTPWTPLAVMPGFGAAAGSRIDGGEAVLLPSLLGSALGTAVAVLAAGRSIQTEELFWIPLAPALGAVLGNRISQARAGPR